MCLKLSLKVDVYKSPSATHALKVIPLCLAMLREVQTLASKEEKHQANVVLNNEALKDLSQL